MKKVTVRSGGLFTVKYKVPRKRVVEFKVIGNEPVNTYVVDDAQLKKLRSGDDYTAYGGFDKKRFHQQVLELFDLDSGDSWYLGIYNPNDEDTDVYYEVLY